MLDRLNNIHQQLALRVPAMYLKYIWWREGEGYIIIEFDFKVSVSVSCCSCGYIWLLCWQRGRVKFPGICSDLRIEEKWWWLVGRCDGWNNWTFSRQLRGALCLTCLLTLIRLRGLKLVLSKFYLSYHNFDIIIR